MSTEQIIFIAIALAFSAFSMYQKAKKQRQASRENEEEPYHNFPQDPEAYKTSDPVVIFERYNAENLPQYSNISTKKNKKKQKIQNLENSNFRVENIENTLQSTESESNIGLLDDFEGTEIQKAFLFGEIFRSTKS